MVQWEMGDDPVSCVDSSFRISLVLDLVSVSTKSGDDDGWV